MHRVVNIRKPKNPDIKIINHRVTTEKFNTSNFPSSFVSEIKFDKDRDGNHKKIGSGLHQSFLGSVIFKDGSKKRVVIKRFNDYLKLDDVSAKKYQAVIDALRNIDLEHDVVYPNRQIGKAKMIPKMAMVKIQENGSAPEWIQVSQAFVRNGESKLRSNHNKIEEFNISEFTWTFLKLGEVGCIKPNQIGFLADIFAHHFEDRSLIPMDIDFAHTLDLNKKVTRELVARDIVEALKEYVKSGYYKDPFKNKYQNFSSLMSALLKHKMDPRLNKILKENWKEYLTGRRT